VRRVRLDPGTVRGRPAPGTVPAVANVEGTVEPKFSRVREAFREMLDGPHELGAALAVVVDGQTVVDLWGGFADRARSRPWAKDTLANVYSTTKGWTALCAHHLVDRGKLDLEAPVASYWPEFAAADKGQIPVRWLLDHRAALPAVRKTLPPEALFDWNAMTSALAEETPWWEPGTKHGYHAITFGWLVGEVIRRVSGCSVGEYFRRELAGPLDLDAHIGLAEVDDARCADLRFGKADPGDELSLVQYMMSNPESVTTRAFTNPSSIASPTLVASRDYRAAQIPAINGHATARAVASLYGAVARGEVLSRDSIVRAGTESSRGLDEILRVETRFGSGFMISVPEEPFGPNEGSFGHPGAGGSVGFADPVAKLGFGFVPSRLGTRIKLDPRAQRLIDATYASLSGA
jgi:CubicO group peptidase (beta-lactamase class C family)